MENTDALTRRGFVAGAGSLAAASVLAPQALAHGLHGRRAPLLGDGTFPESVISGDPSPHGITLWTRVHGAGGRGSVELEVAREPSFRRVVARELVGTSDEAAHSVKARVGGLRPYEEYFYRFSTRTANSPAGRFRTALPRGSRQPVRFAFFSCQDYTFGYYNAHALLAGEDVDFVINLGDYIYAESYQRPGERGGVRLDPIGAPEGPGATQAALTLDDYRAKYRLYRSDENLRRMHERFPMVSTWDDHEVQNDYAGGAGPDGGLAPNLGYSEARRAAAYRAFFESMPTYGRPRRGGTRIFRSLPFGGNVELIMLDERQYRADQPCNDAGLAPECADYRAPRQFLGERQLAFLKRRLLRSRARWKVIGNEVMIMNTVLGANLIGFDTWQGYFAQRREVLEFIRANGIEDVVFVTGDIHTFIAGDVRVDREDQQAVATEFVGGSITSRGIGEGGGGFVSNPDYENPDTPTVQAVSQVLLGANPWVKAGDLAHHGYGVATASPDSFRCTLRRVATIKQPSAGALPDAGFDFTVTPGHPGLLA